MIPVCKPEALLFYPKKATSNSATSSFSEAPVFERVSSLGSGIPSKQVLFGWPQAEEGPHPFLKIDGVHGKLFGKKKIPPRHPESKHT